MSPSQIVKSAYAAARKEGYSHSIKIFARDLAGVSGHGRSIQVNRDGHNLNSACKSWLVTKAKQRAQARKCSRDFSEVYTQQHNRSMQHCAGKGTPVYVREGGRP